MSTKIVETTCTMDCPDACSLGISLADGVIENIGAGEDHHPTSGGFICSKVAGFARRIYHDDRLLHPMRRTGSKGGGTFERISWDDAVGEITKRFQRIVREAGGEAILPYHYGGSNGALTDGLTDSVYFARLGASRLAKTICATPTTEVAQGMYGRMPGVAFEDYVHAKCIILWGANPRASNIHLVPFLQEAKRRGAFVAVIDPRRNLSPDLVDLHLPIYPGTDLPVALGLIRLWHEESKLDREFLGRHAEGLDGLLEKAAPWSIERAAEQARVSPVALRRLADVYARSSPAVLRCGWGIERNRNGGQAVAAVLAIPALLGKFGVRGGGYTLSNRAAAAVDRPSIWNESSWNTRVVNMTQLGEVLKWRNDPIRALFVYNSNPVATVPDQNAVLAGLSRDDLFTVVFDQVLTDTARYADIVLPATTFLEHRDIHIGYGAYVLRAVPAVIEPRGESRSNHEVFSALARAMGFEDEIFSWDGLELLRRVGHALRMNGKAVEQSKLEAGALQLYDFPGQSPIQFESVFPRTTGERIYFFPPALGDEPYVYRPLDEPSYPLALLTPAGSRMTNSTGGEWSYPRLELTMHPDDAHARRIGSGDSVRVYNSQGEVHCMARVSDATRLGVVVMPKGAWMKSSQNSRTSTALCPPSVDNVGGGACFNDARVEVEKLL
jgi:anaerobic selenocysteine-containing dehydrogenase